MSLVKLRAQHAIARRQLTFRRRKVTFYAHRSKRPGPDRKRLLAKWQRLEQAAEANVSMLRRDIAAKTPAPSGRGHAVAWASSKIGITENPAGSNGNPHNISRWQATFGFRRVPWCGLFVGSALKAGGVTGVTSRIASVAAIEDDAKAKRGPFSGWSTDPARAMRGDVAVLFGYGVHTELVEKVLANGALQCIGGNTSSGSTGSQANGGGVFRRIRPRSAVRGVAHVDYPN